MLLVRFQYCVAQYPLVGSIASDLPSSMATSCSSVTGDAEKSQSISGEREPRAAAPSPSHSTETDTRNPVTQDLTWDGPEDADNPQNWPLSKKLISTAIVSLFTYVKLCFTVVLPNKRTRFICPLTSAMVAPAFPGIARDLKITSKAEVEMVLSAFVLGYLIGPFIYAPLSELYGRAIVLHVGNIIFLVFNLACGFAQTFAQMIVFRLFAGLGGIASLSSGSGLLR